MKFSEVIEGLKEGRSFTRGAWMAEAISNTSINYKVKHIVCQIPQTIPADIVPKMKGRKGAVLILRRAHHLIP